MRREVLIRNSSDKAGERPSVKLNLGNLRIKKSSELTVQSCVGRTERMAQSRQQMMDESKYFHLFFKQIFWGIGTEIKLKLNQTNQFVLVFQLQEVARFIQLRPKGRLFPSFVVFLTDRQRSDISSTINQLNHNFDATISTIETNLHLRLRPCQLPNIFTVFVFKVVWAYLLR